MIKSADLQRSCSGRMINGYFRKLVNFSCQFVFFVFMNSSCYYSIESLNFLILTVVSDILQTVRWDC